SAALNTNTMLFASARGLVIALNGTSGALAQRVSMMPNSTNSATAMMSGTKNSGEPQPWVPASTIPYISTIWPMVRVSAPGRSKLRAAPSFLAPSAITAQATPAAATPIGGLISKIQRQLNSWVIIPPNSAPAAPPAPFIAPQAAIARYRAGPGENAIVIAARDEA